MKKNEQPVVLVVDDTPDNLAYMNELLKDDYKVKVANNGEHALTIARSEQQPDLILLDIMMPGMDGYEVCRQLKADAKTRDIPVIFLTALNDTEDEQQGLALGAADYISKPVSPSIVMARIRTHLNLKAVADFLRDKNAFLEQEVQRRIAENRKTEELLRQAQKMEAIGQLAGGVAHDFNNILTVIIGYGNLLTMDTQMSEKQHEYLEQIIDASERAVLVTRGLLAFSRKQVMAPALVDLNKIVQHVQKFLLRVIGEDVKLTSHPGELELPVLVDSAQIEQVLINLATNARDAMPHGGLLSIETGLREIEAPLKHVSGYGEPGRYAWIAVSDTGIGMDQETCRKIFEPFFTTKEVGKGTGLGMAIVYGIIKQHNGFINVYSEPGKGTTFRIHIPLSESDRGVQTVKPGVTMPRGGSETILLAEDDVHIQKLVGSVLTRFGYRVILAQDGEEVVEKFAANREQIRLVLMDVIMPKKNGIEAGREIRALQPGVKILYASGYSADFIKNRGVSEEAIELMIKPVQPLDLLRKVRELLDS